MSRYKSELTRLASNQKANHFNPIDYLLNTEKHAEYLTLIAIMQNALDSN
jgi:hypothetical protein